MPYLTVQQVADLLGVECKAVRRWLLSGDLPGIKLAKYWRIAEVDLEEFLDQRSNRRVQNPDPAVVEVAR